MGFYGDFYYQAIRNATLSACPVDTDVLSLAFVHIRAHTNESSFAMAPGRGLWVAARHGNRLKHQIARVGIGRCSRAISKRNQLSSFNSD